MEGGADTLLQDRKWSDALRTPDSTPLDRADTTPTKSAPRAQRPGSSFEALGDDDPVFATDDFRMFAMKVSAGPLAQPASKRLHFCLIKDICPIQLSSAQCGAASA